MTDPAPGTALRFEGVTKRFGQSVAVDQLTLDIAAGEFFALLGASGCGKTTLLRLAAGFETAEQGRILLDGQDLTGIPPHRRPINLMFQTYALFPHLTVQGNVAFGLKQEGMSKPEIARRVDEMLVLVNLERFGSRKPHQLSGGERQRVALARSLVKRPKVLLLDEPLAALDRRLREQTQAHLADLQRKLRTTFLIVTHDRQEAMTLADRIAVMDQGRIAQVGTPADVYERPQSRHVAELVGDVNLIEAQIVTTTPAGAILEGPEGIRLVVRNGIDKDHGARVLLALRPEKLHVLPAPPTGVHNALPGTITEIAYLGSFSVVRLRLDAGVELKAMVANTGPSELSRLCPADRIWVSFAPEAATVLAS